MNYYFKRALFFAAVISCLTACGGATRSVIKSPDFTERKERVNSEILFVEPTKEFIVVGIIDMRITRQKERRNIPTWLREYGNSLMADAVIPPSPSTKRQTLFESGDPYFVFCLFDDGRTSIIQGRAIRFIKKTPLASP